MIYGLLDAMELYGMFDDDSDFADLDPGVTLSFDDDLDAFKKNLMLLEKRYPLRENFK